MLQSHSDDTTIQKLDGGLSQERVGGRLLSERTAEDPPFCIAIVISSQVSLITLASILDAACFANCVLQNESYRCHCFSVDGSCLDVSWGVSIKTSALSSLQSADLVLLLGDVIPPKNVERQLCAILRRLSCHGVAIGGVGAASAVICETGLAGQHSCCLPWELIDSFNETHPDVDTNSHLYEISETTMTCAGQIAALDMMLEIFRHHHGSWLASAVAETCRYAGLRAGNQSQRLNLGDRLGTSNVVVIRAVQKMEENIEQPLYLAQLAAQIGCSQRQLERQFRRYLDISPGSYYLRLRIETARRLLQGGGLQVSQVSLATGFVSVSHFAKVYRTYFGKSPRHERAST